MLTKEQIDEYRGEDRLLRLTQVCVLTLIFLSCVNYVTQSLNTPYSHLWLVGLAFVVSCFYGFYRYGPISFRESWRIELRNTTTIGYQVVWMLDAQRNLINELERRDHQKLRLGWCLYEPLGGPHREMFLAHGRKGHMYVKPIKHLTVTRCSDGFVRTVSLRTDTPSTETLTIETLLRLLEATSGTLGECAFSMLLEALECSRFSNEFHISELEKERKSSVLLKSTIARLEADPVRQMSEHATSVICAALQATQARGTRVTDLAKILNAGLHRMNEFTTEHVADTP